jgi:hypothetical protein
MDHGGERSGRTISALRRLMSARGVAHPRSRGGQIATFLILVMMAVIVFTMMTANLGQASLAATTVANAADAAALNLGSQLATKSHILQQSLYRSNKGGGWYTDPDVTNRKREASPRRCVKTAFWSIILPVVLALSTVFFPGFMGLTGSWAAAGAGSIGGFVGGAVDYGSLEGAATGALTGFQIGAAIGAGAQAFGVGPPPSGAAGKTAASGKAAAGPKLANPVTETALRAKLGLAPAGSMGLASSAPTFSIGAAQLGASVAASSVAYNAVIADKLETRAMAAAAKALSGLPDRVRIQQSVLFDALSRVVDDPTLVPDNGTVTIGKYKASADVDGDGDAEDDVPRFLYWWDGRLEALGDDILKGKSPEYLKTVRKEIERYFRQDLRPFFERMLTHLSMPPREDEQNQTGAKQVYGDKKLGGVLAWNYDEWDPKAPNKPTLTWQRKDGDGPLMTILRPAEKQVLPWPSNDAACRVQVPASGCPRQPPASCIFRLGRAHHPTATSASIPSSNATCHDLKFWVAGPTEPEIAAWERCEEDCLKACEAQCLTDGTKDKQTCRNECLETATCEQCNADPTWAHQWDELDGARDDIEADLVEWARFVLDPDRRKQILATWDEWVYLFRDIPLNREEQEEDAGDRMPNESDLIPSLIKRIKSWQGELRNLHASQMRPCEGADKKSLIYADDAKASNYPCGFTYDGRRRVTMDRDLRLTNVDKELNRQGEATGRRNVKMDDIELVVYQLERLIGDLETFYQKTGTFMKTMQQYQIGPAPAEAKYEWTDSQGSHWVRAIVGPFLIPKVKPKTTTTLGGRTKCMILRYGQDLEGARTWVQITRQDNTNKLLGLWRWLGGDTLKRSKVRFRWDQVGVIGTK